MSPSDSEFLGDGGTSAPAPANAPRPQSFTDVAERSTGTVPSSTSGNQLVEQPINVRSSEQAGKPRRVTVRARIIQEDSNEGRVGQPAAAVAPGAVAQAEARVDGPVAPAMAQSPDAVASTEAVPNAIAAPRVAAADPIVPADASRRGANEPDTQG